MASSLATRQTLAGVRTAWRSDPKGVSIDLLRIGMGLVWALNMVFILDPANLYFSTFASVAKSYDSQTMGGPAVADFVAVHALFFAWLIAIVTAYLAVAFLLGITTRLACGVGIAASAFFFVTQFLITFMIPGGTDVGAHPLYLLIYVMLFVGGAGNYLAADSILWSGKTRFPRLTRWLLTPRPTRLPDAAPEGVPRTGETKGEVPTPRRAFAARALLAVAALAVLLAGAAEAGVIGQASLTPAPGDVNIVDIHYNISYPGNASNGAFGPAQQDGCFLCTEHLAPGNSTAEEAMLKNTQGGVTVTIESMAVSTPFILTQSPKLPVAVVPGGMWMPVFGFEVPSTPGDYTVYVTVTVH
jgi:hypothetical protein